ncbi:beta-carotene 15,15'-monooxygenase, partial [Ligilactobacillus sp.]|uniref:beta-carotene 15,15'-monooxygenase n=1 Tax=Ligilactobacillus sp. TaxID=2767921 RepID=UPI002FE1D1E4
MIAKIRENHIPETAYLIMFIIFSAAAFIEGTTLTHVFGVDRLMAVTYRVYQLSVLGVLGKIFFLDDSTKKTKAGIFLTLAVLYFICHRVQVMSPFFMAIFIFGAVGVDWKKILKCFFFTNLTMTCLAFLCSLFRIIPNMTQSRMYFGIPFHRFGMGIATPTDFAAHAFSLMLAFILIRGFRCSKGLLTGLSVIAFLTFAFTDARLDLVLMILLLSCTAFYDKVEKFILASGPVFFGIILGGYALFDLWITHVYHMPSRFWETLDRFLSSRLFYGNVAMKQCQVPPLFGRFIPQNGNGLMLKPGEQYFFIDSSIIRMWT